ncbi:UNVERIFIED_CONTAM: hypothetical protein FKN15_002382 [Acipenser sinensis]
MVRSDCNAMPEGSGVYSGGEGQLCRNDSYATLKLQAVLVKAMPSQGRMKQQESLYEYRLMKHVTCDLGEFLCHDQVTCISENWLCDGETDCPDSSDETLDRCTLLQISGLIVACRQLWLSLARVPDTDKFALLDAPISPGHMFGPAVEEILQYSHQERETS